jgi:hypothetical protein
MAHIEGIIGAMKTTLRDFDIVERDGEDAGFWLQSDDARARRVRMLPLAPEIREDGPTMRNSRLLLSLLSTSSDLAGARLSGMMVSAVSMVLSLLMMPVRSPPSYLIFLTRTSLPAPGKTSTDTPLIEVPMECAYDAIDAVPISEAKKLDLSLRVRVNYTCESPRRLQR